MDCPSTEPSKLAKKKKKLITVKHDWLYNMLGKVQYEHKVVLVKTLSRISRWK